MHLLNYQRHSTAKSSLKSWAIFTSMEGCQAEQWMAVKTHVASSKVGASQPVYYQPYHKNKKGKITSAGTSSHT